MTHEPPVAKVPHLLCKHGSGSHGSESKSDAEVPDFRGELRSDLFGGIRCERSHRWADEDWEEGSESEPHCATGNVGVEQQFEVV